MAEVNNNVKSNDYNYPNPLPGDPGRDTWNYNNFNISDNIVKQELQKNLETAKTFFNNRGAVTPASLAAAMGVLANQAMSDAQAKIAAASVSNDPGALMEAQLAVSNATMRTQQGSSMTSELGSTYKQAANYKN